MKLSALSLALAATACLALMPGKFQPAKATSNWLILPQGAPGSAITPTMTEADLVRLYGTASLLIGGTRDNEGEPVPGVVLFPNDPLRRISLDWISPRDHRIEAVEIEGARSLWHTVDGITLSTSLKTLEHLNQGPFQMAGFGFDGSGTVYNWQGGQLALVLGTNVRTRVIIALGPAPNQPNDPSLDDGEHAHLSTEPALQKMNPHVTAIEWQFPR